MKKSYNLNLRNRPFEAILKGKKKIEIRANNSEGDVNYNNIKRGDIIFFRNEDTKQLIKCEVKRKSYYKSIHSLLLNEGTTHTLSSTNCINAGIKSIESIGNYKELINKYGVFAIEIELRTPVNKEQMQYYPFIK